MCRIVLLVEQLSQEFSYENTAMTFHCCYFVIVVITLFEINYDFWLWACFWPTRTPSTQKRIIIRDSRLGKGRSWENQRTSYSVGSLDRRKPSVVGDEGNFLKINFKGGYRICIVTLKGQKAHRYRRKPKMCSRVWYEKQPKQIRLIQNDMEGGRNLSPRSLYVSIFPPHLTLPDIYPATKRFMTCHCSQGRVSMATVFWKVCFSNF